MNALPDVQMLDPKTIRVFVSRARPKPGWEGLKKSMAKIGLKQPIEVRDISHLPAAQRRRPEGGLYKYELNFGEGRLTAAVALGWTKLPAMVAKVTEMQTVGRFLAENMIREALPWHERALLLTSDLDEGMDVKTVAEKYSVSEETVERCRRIVSKTAQGIEDDVATLPMAQAEALTRLPAKDQTIVMQVFREEPSAKQIDAILRHAKTSIEEHGELSVTALKASIQGVTSALDDSRQTLKLKRLHHSLGPQNLQALLGEKKFRAAATKAGVRFEKFEEVCAR